MSEASRSAAGAPGDDPVLRKMIEYIAGITVGMHAELAVLRALVMIRVATMPRVERESLVASVALAARSYEPLPVAQEVPELDRSAREHADIVASRVIAMLRSE